MGIVFMNQGNIPRRAKSMNDERWTIGSFIEIKKHWFFKSSKKNENKQSKIGNDCSYFIDQSNCHQMFNRSFVQTFKTDRFFTERMIFQMNFNNDKFYKANNFLMKCDKTIVFTKLAFLLTNKRFFSKEF